MIAQDAVDDHGIAGLDTNRAKVTFSGNDPNAGGGDEHTVTLPRSTTFVSPVTICTPARDASAAIDATMRRSSAISQPSSMMKAAKQSGRAPPTARSFTVPQTASVPMSPPETRAG